MLTGDNGILNRAGEAKEKTEKATWDEQKDLIILGAQIYAKRENMGMAEYLTKEFEQIDSSATVTDVGNGYYVKCNNQKFIYDNDLNEYEVNEGNDEDWIWTEDSEGNITLTGCKNIYDGNITIPNFINDKPVKIIGKNMFGENQDLLEIKISYGINEIQGRVFKNCTNLQHIEFSTSIVEIQYQAFYGCEKMVGDISNVIPNLNNINSSIFWGCKNLVGDVKIKNGIKSIGGEAFRDCSGLNGVLYIPSSVNEIGAGAFCNCKNLTGDITNIIKNLDSINSSVFFGCEKLTGSISVKEGIKENRR